MTTAKQDLEVREMERAARVAVAKYQKNLASIIRAATGLECDSTVAAIPAMEKQVRSLAKTAPKIIADFLDKIFHRAAAAWTRGNNSGSASIMRQCEKQCELLQAEGENILELWGVKTDYAAGLFPSFTWKDREFVYDPTILMVNISKSL